MKWKSFQLHDTVQSSVEYLSENSYDDLKTRLTKVFIQFYLMGLKRGLKEQIGQTPKVMSTDEYRLTQRMDPVLLAKARQETHSKFGPEDTTIEMVVATYMAMLDQDRLALASQQVAEDMGLLELAREMGFKGKEAWAALPANRILDAYDNVQVPPPPPQDDPPQTLTRFLMAVFLYIKRYILG